MTIYKLRILPLSLLVIGLTTLTSGCKKKDMSLKLNEPRNIRGVVSYKRSFPDWKELVEKALTRSEHTIVPTLKTTIDNTDYTIIGILNTYPEIPENILE